jgi:hypothetical protein
MQIKQFLGLALLLSFLLHDQLFAQVTVVVSNSNPSICTGGNSTLTATPSSAGGTFLWTPGNLTTQSISVSPSSTVTYTVTYTLFGTSASATTTVTVNVSPTLNVTTNAQNNTICTGQSICLTASSGVNGSQFIWSGGQQGATYCASPVNSTSYSVTCTAPNGCSTSLSTPVTVNMAPMIQTGDYAICAGESTVIDANVFPPGGVFSWSTGQGQSSITVSPASSQVFYLSYAVNGCAPVTDSVSVTVNPVPTVSVLDYNVCQGNSQLLSAQVSIPGGSYQWSNGATTTFQTVTPASSSVMWLNYQMPSGCFAIDSFNITVVPTPTATIVNDGINLTAVPNAPGYNYQWINCITQQNMPGQSSPVFPVINGTFAVVVSVAQSQCFDTSDCLFINNAVLDEIDAEARFIFPNPFLESIEIHGVIGDTVTVFDLSGNMIFSRILRAETLQLEFFDHPSGVYFVRKNQEIQKIIKI